MSESDVVAFEAEHGIALPEEYRLFLLQAGGSGAGPYYGILPLTHWDEAAYEVTPDFLRRPFVADPGRELGELWHQELGIDWDERYCGAIAVAHQGCSGYCLLVVSGPARGRIVNVNLDGGAPYFPEDPDYLAWYERWLNELLAGYNVSGFGFSLPGGEHELLAVLDDPAQPASRRLVAARSFNRLPRLEDDTVQRLLPHLDDPEPAIRSMLVALFAWKGRVETLPAVQTHTADADPAVRQAALNALVRLEAPDWPATARRMLSDPNCQVFRTAASALASAGTLRVADLLPRLQESNADLRAAAAHYLGKTGEAALPRLLALLDDPNHHVRLSATQALRDLRHAEAVPKLLYRLALETDETLLSNVLRALEEIGSREAVPGLIQAAGHPNPFVRHAAARILGELGDPRAIPCLTALLQDTVKPEAVDQHGVLVRTTVDRICDRAAQALQKLRSAGSRH